MRKAGHFTKQCSTTALRAVPLGLALRVRRARQQVHYRWPRILRYLASLFVDLVAHNALGSRRLGTLKQKSAVTSTYVNHSVVTRDL